MIDISEKEVMEGWDPKYPSPVVSVRCITYNHVNYISHALDSFLMQQTNFPFEILVHDDCSTDGTIEVLRTYEQRFPNILKVMYEEENQYSKKGGLKKVLEQLDERCSGKYIAICEGDDYWISSQKLQLQYDALENSHMHVCVCRTMIDTSSAFSPFKENCIPDSRFPYQQSGVIDSTQLAELIFNQYPYPFHTSSYLYTKDFRTYTGLDGMRGLTEGDEILLKKLIVFGGVYFLNEALSCYRWGAEGCWTSRFLKKNDKEKYRHYVDYVRANIVFDNVTNQQYHKYVANCNFNRLGSWLYQVDTKMVLSDIDRYIPEDKTTLGGKKTKAFYHLARYCPMVGHMLFQLGRVMHKW